MSLTSRARRVQRVFGLKYQTCHQLVVKHGEEAKAIAVEKAIPLGDADCIVMRSKGYKDVEPLAGEP